MSDNNGVLTVNTLDLVTEINSDHIKEEYLQGLAINLYQDIGKQISENDDPDSLYI